MSLNPSFQDYGWRECSNCHKEYNARKIDPRTICYNCERALKGIADSPLKTGKEIQGWPDGAEL